MEKQLTKQELIDWFRTFKTEDLFCPFCCGKLQKREDNKFYCSNEMCLNDKEY